MEPPAINNNESQISTPIKEEQPSSFQIPILNTPQPTLTQSLSLPVSQSISQPTTNPSTQSSSTTKQPKRQPEFTAAEINTLKNSVAKINSQAQHTLTVLDAHYQDQPSFFEDLIFNFSVFGVSSFFGGVTTPEEDFTKMESSPRKSYASSSSNNSSQSSFSTTGFGPSTATTEASGEASNFSAPIPKDAFKEYFKIFSPVEKEHELKQKQIQAYNKSKTEFEATTTKDPVAAAIEDGVPALFFDDEFNLSKPSFFNAIFSDESLVATLLLQEKLSHYLDTVELLLGEQAACQSKPVFSALSNYNDVNEEITNAFPLIHNLRARISQFKKYAVDSPLKTVNLVTSKKNLNALLKKMEIIQKLKNWVESIELLLSIPKKLSLQEKLALSIEQLENSSNNQMIVDFPSVLDLIDGTKRVLEKEKDDLAGIKSVREMELLIEDYSKKVKYPMEKEFSRIILQIDDNKKQYFTDSVIIEAQIEISTSNLNSMITEPAFQKFETKLNTVVSGLVKGNHLTKVLEDLKKKTMEKANSIVGDAIGKHFSSNRGLSNEIATANPENPIPSKERIQALPQEQFLELINVIFGEFYKIACKIQFICFSILKTQISSSGNSQFICTLPEDLQSKVFDILETLIEVCYARCKMLFISRDAQIEMLDKQQIIDQMEKTFTFTNKIDSLLERFYNFSLNSNDKPFSKKSGRKIDALFKGVVLEQGQKFLTEFHKKQMEILKQKVDIDRWAWDKAFDGDLAKAQQIVDKLTKNQSLPASQPTTASQNFETFIEDLSASTQSTNDPLWNSTDGTQPASSASTESSVLGFLRLKKDHSFPIPKCVLELIFVVDLYFDLINQQFIQPFELAKKLYFLFSAFNKEVSEVILRAKAIKTANIKKVTANNLMLAEECINFLTKFISELLPQITAKFSQNSTNSVQQQNSVISDFNALISDFDEHKDKLFDKTREIVDAILETQMGLWQTILWNEKSKTPSNVMMDLLKSMAHMRLILCKYLGTHRKVLTTFFSELVGKCVNVLKDVIENSKFEEAIKTDVGKARLWADIWLFKKQMQKWSGLLTNEMQVNTNQLEICFSKKYGPPPTSKIDLSN